LHSVAQLKALPAKRTTTISGSCLEYTIGGTGRPAIVLMAGAAGPVESWFRVHAQLASLATVFAYNRPGVGASDEPTTPQTGEQIVSTLRSLLVHVGLTAPYVLVGHSLGGLYANLFARAFPDEMAGVVMLDAATPEDVVAMQSSRGALQKLLASVSGAFARTREFDETAHVLASVEQINKAGAFPDVPLVVVTGGKPAMSWLTPAKTLRARRDNQRALVGLSPQGRQIIARRSGHFPQFSEPQVVVDAVRMVIASRAETGPLESICLGR
jgi:pimeloyl-ACP methyl ester carboxylesterase